MPRWLARGIASAVRAYGRSLPLAKRGYLRLSRNRLIDSSFMSLEPRRLARLRNGMRVEVDPGDFDGRLLDIFGSPEPSVAWTCQTLLGEADCFLDIGANHGSVGLMCQPQVPAGSVHFFEPQPELARRIREAVELAKLKNAYVHEAAVSDREEYLTLVQSAMHSGKARLAPELDIERSETGERQWVQVLDINRVLAEVAGERRVSAKVDVEGAEGSIVPQFAAYARLGFVVFECGTTSARAAIGEAARAHDRVIFGIRPSLTRVYLHPIEALERAGGFKDFLLLPASPALGALERPVTLRTLAGLLRQG